MTLSGTQNQPAAAPVTQVVVDTISIGAIVGAVLGGIAGVVLLVVILRYMECCCFKPKPSYQPYVPSVPVSNPATLITEFK
jgi:hypothetical protein